MSRIYDLTSGFDRVSIVGMSKNAGKTTVLNRLILDCGADGLDIALCSVGRDGEKIDVVTKKKKPEIFVSKGTLFATTASLVASCDVEKERLLSTGVGTALGEVIVFRALSDGYIELSGPSMNSQLPALIDYFLSCGVRKVLIDGAVSRKASSSPVVAGCTILCAGADYNSDMSIVVADTAHAAGLLCTGALCDARAAALISEHENSGVQLIDKDYNTASYIPYKKISDQDRLNARYVYFPGALTDRAYESTLGGRSPAKGISLVSANASKLMISRGTTAKMASRGVGLCVLNPVRLACVCINPHASSGPDFDKDMFHSQMQSAVALPVINVNDE